MIASRRAFRSRASHLLFASMATRRSLAVDDVLRVNGSRRFAAALAAASPFASLADALIAARRIWLNEVDVTGWLEAFAAHPAIGTTSPSVSKWCKEEQSAAISTATDSTAQELADWNAKYREKFGFVFMICASGRTAPEVLAELKRRYTNRPIVELEGAAQEELKITELRLAKLFQSDTAAPPTSTGHTGQSDKAADRMRIIGAHLGTLSQPSANKAPALTGSSNRTRPPITTHVLDTARGSPASGIEVHLEMWKDASSPPSFNDKDFNGWATVGSSVTNNDGRSGQLMDIVDNVTPGFYRISFNTAKYAPLGFFPYVSIIFEIKEGQMGEHFHVPLLHSPFSFTTYRGS